ADDALGDRLRAHEASRFALARRSPLSAREARPAPGGRLQRLSHALPARLRGGRSERCAALVARAGGAGTAPRAPRLRAAPAHGHARVAALRALRARRLARLGAA